MAERPILFAAPMIRALINGRKSMTRCMVKQQDIADVQLDYLPWSVGDLLWVRETWKPHSLYADLPPREVPKSKTFYRADDQYAPSNTGWTPSIHMPRWASRLTLEVTGVKVERLQEISEEDAVAEGAREPSLRQLGGELRRSAWCERQVFARLWSAINGPGAWDANPWVAAVSFIVHHANIDALPRGRQHEPPAVCKDSLHIDPLVLNTGALADG